MVDKNDVYLKININYGNNQCEILLTDLLPVNEIIKKAMDNFNIPKKKENSFFFYYNDQKGNMNQINENDNLFELSSEIPNQNLYLLNLVAKLSESQTLNEENIDKIENNKIEEINQNDINNNENEMNNIDEKIELLDKNKNSTISIIFSENKDEENEMNKKNLEIEQDNKNKDKNNINNNKKINNSKINDNNKIKNNNNELKNELSMENSYIINFI